MVERMPPGTAAPMPRRTWWLIVLRGLAALGFGLIAIFWPGISLAALVMLFGAYALLDGAITLGLALRLPAGDPGRGILTVTGIAGLLIGLVSVLWPQVTVTLLIYILAAWLVLFGLIAIAHSLQMKKQVGAWPLSRGGILLLVLGLLLLLFPNAVAVAATWVLGALALLIGGGLLAFAWRRQQRDSMIL
ncbi:MAG: DUF308 domain-containing protein [Ferrovibrio sp.]|uniref:HdeD family acid-resistance protein n=1 Tax=Ferrovibrio sp. TaxID=1917215 RepID=UPI0026180F2F|nr:DUF308 domain-containing protein [Ferrovibrio sp.]MCW0233826.1 DUF308 domain-containing protein [Ferrovibrio sp.]